MKSDFIFSKRNISNRLVPIPYDYKNTYIIGLLLNSCIRFYKSFDYSSIRNYRVKRVMCANAYNFEVFNNYINFNDNYEMLKEYNFSNEVYIIDCESFFDVVEKEDIKEYLKDFYFDSNIENRINNNSDLCTKRFCSDKPKVKFKSNYRRRTI